MIRFKKWAAPVALFVVLGAAPALAGEGGAGPAPEQALLASGMSAEDIDYLRSEGLGYPQIYTLQQIAESFGVDAVVLYQAVDGKVAWGKLARLFDANFGAFLQAYHANG